MFLLLSAVLALAGAARAEPELTVFDAQLAAAAARFEKAELIRPAEKELIAPLAASAPQRVGTFTKILEEAADVQDAVFSGAIKTPEALEQAVTAAAAKLKADGPKSVRAYRTIRSSTKASTTARRIASGFQNPSMAGGGGKGSALASGADPNLPQVAPLPSRDLHIFVPKTESPVRPPVQEGWWTRLKQAGGRALAWVSRKNEDVAIAHGVVADTVVDSARDLSNPKLVSATSTRLGRQWQSSADAEDVNGAAAFRKIGKEGIAMEFLVFGHCVEKCPGAMWEQNKLMLQAQSGNPWAMREVAVRGGHFAKNAVLGVWGDLKGTVQGWHRFATDHTDTYTGLHATLTTLFAVTDLWGAGELTVAGKGALQTGLRNVVRAGGVDVVRTGGVEIVEQGAKDGLQAEGGQALRAAVVEEVPKGAPLQTAAEAVPKGAPTKETLHAELERLARARGMSAKAQRIRRIKIDSGEITTFEQITAEPGAKVNVSGVQVVDDAGGITNNGSGDSSASIEAINRNKNIKFYKRLPSGKEIEVIGVDGVDTVANPKNLKPGESFIQVNVKTGERTTILAR